MVTVKVQTLEDEAQDFIAALWEVVDDFVWATRPEIRLGETRFTEDEVDDVDRLYCRVEAACDGMRRALVARQTGRTG